MEFDVWLVANNVNGRQQEYLLRPDISDRLFVQAESLDESDGTRSISVEIPDIVGLEDRAITELEYIHALERSETLRKKAIRKIVDWGLAGQGTFVTGAVSGLGVYEVTQSVVPSIAAGFGGLVGHEILRRPFVGARHFAHQIKNPWSPAAQSTARIRKTILET